jgi:alanine transaminase
MIHIPRGLGAYANSQGIEYIREQVASYIAERDGQPADKADIFLTDGASAGVKTVMQTLFASSGSDGVLIPFPQ